LLLANQVFVIDISKFCLELNIKMVMVIYICP